MLGILFLYFRTFQEFYQHQIAITKTRKPVRPELWDGNAAGRCIYAIIHFKV